MKRILMEHIFKYPQMEVQDAVKLIYQSVFGCAHLVKDRESCKKWIEAERAEHMTDAPVPAFEHIGGGYVRFYLNSAEARCIPSDFIADMFVESSRHNDGDQEMFEKGLTALSELADRQKTPFTAAELEQYIAGYRAGGYPMVSHTARYNEVYRPAYRVILKKYADIWSVIKGISQIIEEKDRCIAAIDGRSASGKSTLAEVLKNTFGAAVVHMDDFFLPAELRKPERFAEPGGNVHYERFNEEVTPNLGKNFAYRVLIAEKCS